METSFNNDIVNTVSEIELVYRPKIRASLRPTVISSQSVYDILMASWNPDQIELLEQFKVVLLNRRNKVLGIIDHSTGGISGTVCDLRLIFAAALKANACAIIIAHNHPSGIVQPSEGDKKMTEKIKQAGELLGVKLLDHVIVSVDHYYSFADNGLL
ncbi:JAB domain-containing protein [Pedobacter sp. ASV28]|uniref:JAB domain-containing protein n=1 Tax=Pedobacter sp. ASV28 TaxID=2795123 RepID=UPI0018EAE3DE|nr:JAB domain-containing protein [Pedobacter sp. ASV28]